MNTDLIEKSFECLKNIDFKDATKETARDVILNEYVDALKGIYTLRQKINKAISYIEELPVMFYPDDLYEDNHKEYEWDKTELIKILKGEEDESN